MKKCRKCDVEKAHSDFAKNAKRSDGLRSYCRVCEASELASRKKKDPERFLAMAAARAQKWRERYPERSKESNQKYRAAHPEKCREWGKRWQLNNREKYLECHRQSSKKAYAANPEKRREYQKKWQATEHGKAINRAKAKRWRDRHLEEARERDRVARIENREQILATARRWREANAASERERLSIRKRLKSEVPAWGEPAKIKVVYRMARKLRLEVDHIVPFKSDIVSGLHVWHNLQLLDKRLNMVKRNRHWPDMP